ncbi:MAG: hypothetical protein OXH70_17300 [Acidobacteria bacterium]|nr:hypothetical protein [Acidobacteriota bacterium]
MWYRAKAIAGDDAAANLAAEWSHYCRPQDYALPDLMVDGSGNFCPGLRAARGDWSGLEQFFDLYKSYGWGLREFNSPLYTGRVYMAAALGAWARGFNPEWDFFRKWTIFLALQSVFVSRKPKEMSFVWGDEKTTLPVRQLSGLYLPPTGMRANVASIADPMVCPLLSEVLGVPYRINGTWDEATAPVTPQDYEAGRTTRSPHWYFHAYKLIANTPLPWTYSLRRMLLSRIANVQVYLEDLADFRLPKPIGRFIIERKGDDVLTAWEGHSTSVQKCAIPAAKFEGGKISVLAPATNVGHLKVSQPVISTIGENQIIAWTSRSPDPVFLRRLEKPDVVMAFYPDRAPEVL